MELTRNQVHAISPNAKPGQYLRFAYAGDGSCGIGRYLETVDTLFNGNGWIFKVTDSGAARLFQF